MNERGHKMQSEKSYWAIKKNIYKKANDQAKLWVALK